MLQKKSARFRRLWPQAEKSNEKIEGFFFPYDKINPSNLEKIAIGWVNDKRLLLGMGAGGDLSTGYLSAVFVNQRSFPQCFLTPRNWK